MGITNLGAVGITSGGAYNPETVYKKYKVVSANGGSYMYINTTPAAGVPVTETSHWQQIAAKGDRVELTGPWDVLTTYSYYQSAEFYGSSYIYINATPSAGHTPLDIDYWMLWAKRGEQYVDTTNLTWQGVRDVVRQGMGPTVFPVGSKLQSTHTLYGNIVWDVVAHNYNLDPSGKFTKSMTLLMNKCIANVVFDAPEANYKITTQINSGALCNIALESNTIASATYDFTAPQNLVVGGLLRLNTAAQMQYYATPTSTAVNIAISAGAVNPSIASSLSAQNNKIRVSSGSNNWGESAIRQFLNSSGAAGTYWAPKTDYDLVGNATLAGLLNGMDENFLAVLGQTDRITAKNTVNEGGGSYMTRDLFYLPSITEIYGTANNAINEGTQFPYYAGTENADKIKYLAASISHWWLRSPNSSTPHVERIVAADGSVQPHYGSGGVVAACVIY